MEKTFKPAGFEFYVTTEKEVQANFLRLALNSGAA